jgi:hypothetical protein
LVAVLGLTGCGDDDAPGDARASAIGSLTEYAVDAWAESGPQALLGLVHPDDLGSCTAARLEQALSGQPKPTAWRNTRNITFPTQDTATATVIVVQDGNDVEQQWTFKLEQSTRWRIASFPGLSECAAS